MTTMFHSFHLAFVDYSKAFNSVEQWVIFRSRYGIVLISYDIDELQQIVIEFKQTSVNIELSMNLGRTKIITSARKSYLWSTK